MILDSDHKSLVLTTKIPADLLTPVAVLLKIKTQYPNYNFLLESVEKGANRGRYSAIGALPDLIWKVEKAQAFINKNPQNNFNDFEIIDDAPLISLRKLIKASQIQSQQNLPNLSSGLFGYMGYDMARMMEKLPDNNLADEIAIPDAIFIRPQIIIIFDNVYDLITICAPIYYQQKIDVKIAYHKAQKNIEDVIDLINNPIERTHIKPKNAPLNFISHLSEDEYCAAVLKAKEYIKNGDIFQVLPSQRFNTDFDQANSFAFYRALRRLNPSPFLFYLQFGDFILTGSSPEIMASKRDRKVIVRPLAGTRKRGASPEEDRKIAAELLSNEKELAEHLMLIDLGRHDVGRVAVENSVIVSEKMVIENYSHVMHISSTVEGILRDDLDALDALISTFPAGTVSGAPKIRAMEIIEELEKEKRGFYGGCVGYFAGNGDMETCIAIRCALIKNNKIYLQAGAGVVFDSIPEAEYQECLNKARALMIAADNINQYL